MKGLMAKLKGLNFKQLLVVHGEKMILGAVGLIVLLALFSTTWAGYEKKPEELLSKATDAGAKLNTGDMTEEKLKDFKESTYQRTAMDMFVKLNVAPSNFAYDKPMSFPLYPRQEPRAETTWPAVQHLLADGDVMVLGITPAMELGEGMEGEAGVEGAAAPGAPTNPLGAAAATIPMPTVGNPLGGPMAGMMAGASGTGMQPRGQRYVAVRGIVNLFEIGRAIQKANHLESLAEAIAAIEVVDFKIERQKAVAGDNPWPDDSWQEMSLERVDEVLAESGQAADLVDSGVTNPVFTMPLPSRLDGDYSTIVSHPMLKDFQLTKEQRELEQKLNAALLDEAEQLGVGEEQSSKRRGFMNYQVDINTVRNSVYGNSNFKADEFYTKNNIKGGGMGGMGGMGGPPGMGTMMPPGGNAGNMRPPTTMGGGMSSRNMMPPSAPPMMGGGAAPMMPMMGGGPPGMGMGGMGMGGMMGQGQVQQVGGAAVGYLMLFRFLDFDVNPGEAYRYRVKLEFTNPNYGLSLDQVKEASVAEGESRFSDWSEPTAPVVVKHDTNFFLARVDKRARTRGEAEFHIFQWDPGLGTYIDSKKLVAKYGQFVGGLEESERLDLGTPTLEKKTVLFASKDFLLDTSLPPPITPADNPDLNLTVGGRQAKDGLDLPVEAVVIDEYGELRVLDSVSQKADEEAIEKNVKKERAPYEALRDAGGTETNPLNAAGAAAPPMMEMMMGGMGGPASNLKRGKNGKATKSAAATGASAYGTAPGYPGGKGAAGKAGGPPGYGTAPGYPTGKSKKSMSPP